MTKPQQQRPAIAAAPWARLRPAWTALAVLVLLALLYPGAMFQGKVFQSPDAQSAESFRQVGDAALAHGHYPLWNPYIFLGMPTFGSLAFTPGLYPPGLVLDFLQRQLHFPPLTWLLAHLLFGGLGMMWLLGRWRLPPSARVLGTVGWLFFARVVAWSVYGHGTKVGAAMYVPWLVGLTWEVLTTGRLRALAWLSLLLGLQFLRGHLQITYYTLLLLGWLVAWHLAWPLDGTPPLAQRLRRAGLVAVAFVVAFMLGAVLLLPVQRYAGISTRGQVGEGGGVGFDYATSWSLGPQEIPTLVQPGAVGFGKATYLGPMPFTDYPNYLGWLWLALAAAAWATRRRSLVIACGVLAVLAVLAALGNRSPGLYQAMYAALPYFNKFRVPSMVLIVLALLAALLAGHGAQALTESARARRAMLWALAVIGGLTLLAGATGATASWYEGHLRAVATASGKQVADVLVREAWQLQRFYLVRDGLVMLAAAGAIFAAMRHASFRARGLIWVLAGLLAVDLGSVAHLITSPDAKLQQIAADAQGRGHLVPATPLIQAYHRRTAPLVDPALAKILEGATGHGRVYPLAGDSQDNAYMTVGVRSLGGYYPAKPAAAEQVRKRLFAQTPSGRLANWLAADAVTFGRELPPEAFDLLRRFDLDLDPAASHAAGTWVYHNRRALPRARLVDRWQPAGTQTLPAFLDSVMTGAQLVGPTVLLDQEPDPKPVAAADSLPVPTIVQDGLDEVRLQVAAPRPCLLVLADLAAPGWRVHVDGQPRPLLTADLILRAVALPSGDHEVVFRYEDPAVRLGLIVSLVGALGVAVLFVVAARRTGR